MILKGAGATGKTNKTAKMQFMEVEELDKGSNGLKWSAGYGQSK